MRSVPKTIRPSMPIVEMKEFASFPAATQRYIRRSLDVASNDERVLDRWARDPGEVAAIGAQRSVYDRLQLVRELMPATSGLIDAEPMMSPLVTLAGFDLGQGRLPSFMAFRFLYERLLGAVARPWLPSAFMAAAGLPHLSPALRGTLLRSISEAAATAAGWAAHEPAFFPSWVEKVEMAA